MVLDEVYDSEFLFFTYDGAKYEGMVVSVSDNSAGIVINTRERGILSFKRSNMERVYKVHLNELPYIVKNGNAVSVISFDGSVFKLHSSELVWLDANIRETCQRLKNNLTAVQSRSYFYPITINSRDNSPTNNSQKDYSYLRKGDVIVYEMNGEMLEGTILNDCQVGDNYLSVYKGGSKFDGGGYDRHNTFIGGLTFLRKVNLADFGVSMDDYRFNRFCILDHYKDNGLDVRDNNDLTLLPLPDDTFYLIPEIGLDNCMGNFVEDLI